MGLWKSIESGKEHRKQYRHSKLFARSCRNHGGCPYCEGNRTHKYDKKIIGMKDDLKSFLRGD